MEAENFSQHYKQHMEWRNVKAGTDCRAPGTHAEVRVGRLLCRNFLCRAACCVASHELSLYATQRSLMDAHAAKV